MLPAVALPVSSAPDMSQRPGPPHSSAEAAFLSVLADLPDLSAAPEQALPGGTAGAERPEPTDAGSAERISPAALPCSSDLADEVLLNALSASVFGQVPPQPFTAARSADAMAWIMPMQAPPPSATADPARSAEAALPSAAAEDAVAQTLPDLSARPNGDAPARRPDPLLAVSFPAVAPPGLPEPATRSPVTSSPNPAPGGGPDIRSAPLDDMMQPDPDESDRMATARAAPDPTVPQPDKRPTPPSASFPADLDGFPQPQADPSVPTLQGDAALSPVSNSPLPAQTAPPTPPSASPFVAQLAEELHAVSARAEDGTVTLQLRPEELGKLQFHLTRTPEGLHIHLVVDQPATLDLLRKHADDLLGDLRQDGFAGTTLSFAGSGAGDGSSDNPDLPDRPHPPEAADRNALFTPLHPPARHHGALDLRL